MGSVICLMCQRRLTDKESVTRGVGPECEQKRAKYLAQLDTSETEILALETSPSVAAHRWVRLFNAAMCKGRIGDAARFLNRARSEQAVEKSVEASAPVMTPECSAVIALLGKGSASYSYLYARLGKRDLTGDFYKLLASMVVDGKITKLPDGQYALPGTQSMPVSAVDNLRTQYGQAVVDEYLWARANSSVPDSEIFATVIERAKAGIVEYGDTEARTRNCEG